MKKGKFDVGECSHVVIEHRSNEGVGDELVLESKHKIFLSHSGVQKEFVEHLCKALEDRCHYPFFDRRPESLLKGKEFSNLIIKAAQQCQLLVVVVSEDYFMSKWPMIELNAFVQASKKQKTNMNVGILPLFYGLSVSDLKDEKNQQRWLEKWETFALKDDRIKVDDWRFAIYQLTNFNGLPYDRELKEILAYENQIVSHICTLVLPDIKWNDSHLQGNVHEVLFEKMNQIELSQMYKVKVIGLYGVGGIGKTTTCKRLCNDLSNEYDGRVCHVEFDSTCSNSKELLQNAVMKLIRKSEDFVRQLDEGECIDILERNLRIYRTFLAIDNVWDNSNSMKQAQMFLAFPSHEDSLVLVTARSQSTLDLLGIDGDACLEMPGLSQGEATSLFLYYAAPREEFTRKEDMDSIEWCIKKCYFCKGDGEGYHYHPLALEALGRQLRGFKENPSEWVHRLSRVWKSRSFLGENVVFDVLRSSFDLLQPTEQTLFMDVGLYLCSIPKHYDFDWIGWKELLCVLYKKDEFKIQSQLDSLKRKGLLQDVDLTLGRITMHDLYHEFVILEATGKSGATTDIWDRKWMLVYGDDEDLLELELTPAGGCWQKLSRLSIREDFGDHWLPNDHALPNLITNLEGIEWQYFSNVLVLQLYGLKSIRGSLNLKGMKCLRSLQLKDFRHLERLEGLESLKHLTYFEWTSFDYQDAIITDPHIMGQFPASLKYMYINGPCVLSEPNVLAHCNNLIKIDLAVVKVGVLLDLSNCSSLEGVRIFDIKSLQTLSIGSSRLQTLDLHSERGYDIQGLDQLHGLIRLNLLVRRTSWKVPCLLSLTKLQTLTVPAHTKRVEHCIPHQLQELYYRWWIQREAPCLNAFKQLQVLDFSGSDSLTQMHGMGDLPALRSLDLAYCESLKRLPNLSKSRSLEELVLDDCYSLQLHEEDFEMLATLPILHPIPFSHENENQTIRVDIVGQKVLRYLGPTSIYPSSWLVWKEGELEELELGPRPIKIGNRGIWDFLNHDESDMEEEDIKSDTEELDDVDLDMENMKFI